MKFPRRHLEDIPAGRRALAAFAALLAFLVASEIFLRSFHAKETRNDMEYYAARTFSREEWRIAAAIRDLLLERGLPPRHVKGTALYLYEPVKSRYYTINADGLRGLDILPKEPGEYRIAITGASVAFGTNFADGATMPALVGDRLRERCPGCRITVHNLGIEGYDLQRDIELVRRLLPKMRPDLVVFYTGGIDLNYGYTEGYRRHEPYPDDAPFDEKDVERVRGMYRSAWYDRSRLARLVADAVRREKGLLPEPARAERDFDPALPPELARRAEEFAQGLAGDMAAAEEELNGQGVGTLFVLATGTPLKDPRTPLESSVLKGFDAWYPHFGAFALAAVAAVRRAVAERGIGRFHDLADAFDGVREDVFYDLVHLTPRGNRMLAEKMTEALVAEGVTEKARAAATPSPSRPDRSPAP